MSGGMLADPSMSEHGAVMCGCGHLHHFDEYGVARSQCEHPACTCSHRFEPAPPPRSSPSVACNWCGLSCDLEGEDYSSTFSAFGGYNSTPGNGSGALDDLAEYSWSLCEFCLDHLFAQLKIPPVTSCRNDGPEPFVPAAERVQRDDWRGTKAKFYAAKARHDAARAIVPRPAAMVPAMTPAEQEQQRRSFAAGNVGMSNPAVTREVVDRAAEAMQSSEAAADVEQAKLRAAMDAAYEDERGALDFLPEEP